MEHHAFEDEAEPACGLSEMRCNSRSHLVEPASRGGFLAQDRASVNAELHLHHVPSEGHHGNIWPESNRGTEGEPHPEEVLVNLRVKRGRRRGEVRAHERWWTQGGRKGWSLRIRDVILQARASGFDKGFLDAFSRARHELHDEVEVGLVADELAVEHRARGAQEVGLGDLLHGSEKTPDRATDK